MVDRIISLGEIIWPAILVDMVVVPASPSKTTGEILDVLWSKSSVGQRKIEQTVSMTPSMLEVEMGWDGLLCCGFSGMEWVLRLQWMLLLRVQRRLPLI